MRLIDADALPRHGQRGGIVHWKDIDNAPTIDAVANHQLSEETSTLDICPYYHHEPTGEPFCEMEDRWHGTWKDIDGDGTYWLCSVCGEVLCCNNNFCPNCGAKMDGGGDAE